MDRWNKTKVIIKIEGEKLEIEKLIEKLDMNYLIKVLYKEDYTKLEIKKK